MKKTMLAFALLVASQLCAQEKKASNPIIFADVPDPSVIRVGHHFYMSSTTMHMSPGLPIMKSSDLVNWKLCGYAYDTLVNDAAMNLEEGKSAYGKGSWASSLRYHKGRFYVSTFSATSGRTHIYTTDNIEKGPWKETSFMPNLHDHTLFFDDDGKPYMIYGSGRIKLVELKDDLSGILPGSERVIIENAGAPSGGGGLPAEGSQLFKFKGKYYLFNITWPKGGMRTVVIHRADRIEGPYQGKVALQDLGVAQGGLIDMPDGRWFAYLFRDFGAVGRIPYLVPVTWQDGWPLLGDMGKVPSTIDLSAKRSLIPGIIASDDFDRKNGDAPLPSVWQWNHNPDNKLWSLTERKGFLRLKTGRIDTSFLQARNTLTQRTLGPVCEGSVLLDISHLKAGDFAGISMLQKNYALLGVKVQGIKKKLVMVNASTGIPVEVESIPLSQDMIYLKANCDFRERRDVATFSYSLDGVNWRRVGTSLRMSYTLPHFMGYRFGLFNYASKEVGGYADYDYFNISESINEQNTLQIH